MVLLRPQNLIQLMKHEFDTIPVKRGKGKFYRRPEGRILAQQKCVIMIFK